MSDTTLIEWTDATWNPITGCSVTSPGCTKCYAMKLAGGRLRNHPTRKGLTQPSKAGPVWTGEVRFNAHWLNQPIKWKRPRRIFVCAHGDLFHENVPEEWIDKVFAVMAVCPQHSFQVLTKRAKRMHNYINEHCAPDFVGAGIPLDRKPTTQWPLPNVWLGVSVEDQDSANDRIPYLLETDAAVRFLSCEPLLGPVDLTQLFQDHPAHHNALAGEYHNEAGVHKSPSIDWVIVGGESGPGARPMHIDWARTLRDQCEDAEVTFFFKQWGEYAPGEIAGQYLDPEKAAVGFSYFDGRWDECWSDVDGHRDDEPDIYRIGKARAGRMLDGVIHDAMPDRGISP